MSRSPFFQLLSTDGGARRGRLKLTHGEVETPVFMPVATNGAIKTILPSDLEAMGSQMILNNTYHMMLRPGVDLIAEFGGLHDFIKWPKPILTDSGGFQLFSLSGLAQITEASATFRSHIDGKMFDLSPERAVEIQEIFGSDVHMVLDECTSHPVDHAEAKRSMERSMRWALRCRSARKRPELAQFGIVQGNVYPDLREESCRQLQEIGFDGYAIGGLSVGEEKTDMRAMTALCCDLLPQDQARYLMGVGTPMDLLESVALGIDMFDCVMPSRNARRGTLFTSTGRLNIKNQKHRTEHGPIDEDCRCPTCATFSRAFLRHMFFVNESTSYRLLTIHNLYFYVDLMRSARLAIEEKRYASFVDECRKKWERSRL